MSEKWLQLQCFPIGPFSGWHGQLVERQQITVCWAHPWWRLSICYWCYFWNQEKVSFEMMRQDCTCWTNYPEKVEEGLDDNDAVANISGVQTAGILLAQQYIRTSLMTLITCVLTNILSAVDSDGVNWKWTSLRYDTRKRKRSLRLSNVVIVSYLNFPKSLFTEVLLSMLPITPQLYRSLYSRIHITWNNFLIT